MSIKALIQNFRASLNDSNATADIFDYETLLSRIEERLSLGVENQLSDLIDEGLHFSSCVRLFHQHQRREFDRYVQLAQAKHHKDGELEIDDYAVVSLGEDTGAYVMAWVWVGDDDA